LVWRCWFFAAPILGQTFGEITGEIRDSSGGIIVSAQVSVTNQATGGTRTAKANQDGVYSFPSLPPGLYDLKVTSPGFEVVTRKGIELQVQQTARIDFALPVGEVTQTIEISGGAPLLTTEDATVGTVIENRRIVDLPLNGRNALGLVFLSPNVTFGFGSSNVGLNGDRGAFSSVSIAGARPVFNHYTLDGLENTYVEGNSYAFLPSIDALQEFKIQSGVYPAEFGREVGQINVSTKPGGNQYHGALFEFLRNSDLDAEPFAFTRARPPNAPFRWNQYGFTLGGPIWIPKILNGRNRLFFMANYEGFRDRKQLRLFSDVPSVAMRSGNFSQISAQIFDPATRVQQGSMITAQPFPGNIIPQNRLARTSLQMLEFLPQPNQPGPSLSSDYQVSKNSSIDRDQFNQRIDFVESASSNWFGRYSWGTEASFSPGVDLNGGQTLNDPWQAMISNTRTLSPNFVNDFRFGVSRFSNNGVGELAGVRNAIGELKIPGVSLLPPDGWGLPTITYSGLSGFGGTPGGTIRYSATFQWVDNVFWVHGKHALRFGVEVRRERWNASSYTFGQGQFDFFGTATQNPVSPSGSGYAFADYMLGEIGNSRAGVNQAFAQFRATDQAYYIDDSWKLRPNFTITIGLRYEYSPPWYDKSQKWVNGYIPTTGQGQSNVADPGQHPVLVRIGSGDFYQGVNFRFNPAIQVARDGRFGDRGVFPDRTNFAPRLGFAGSPSSRWTIRTGAGLFYSQDTSAPKLDPARNLAGFRSEQASSDFPNLTWDAPFSGLSQSVQVNTPSVLANDPHRRTPYTIQYLFNIQRELMNNMVLEVGYLGSIARRLEQWHNFNSPDPSPIGSVQSRAPWPEFGRVFQVSGFGKADYNALAAKLQRRFSSGLTYLVSYTWSKSIDTGSGIRVPPGDQQFTQNEFCVSCDRATSSFSADQRFVTSLLYELPFGKGKPLLNHGGLIHAIVGGWQMGSIVTLQSGFPVTVLDGKDQSNTGHQYDRPNATGQATALARGSQDPQRFFNTAAYVLEPFGAYGNAGRNTVTGPGLMSWDFSTLKRFPIKEQRDLEFRFEVFNMPNHPNWGIPNATVTSTSFGKITTTSNDMRELQFALKLNF
jgi:Carboxypeptidase regulatory-like domain